MKTALHSPKIFCVALFIGALLTPIFGAEPDAAAVKQRVTGLARKVSIRGHQISSMGITGTMTVKRPVRKEVPGNRFKVAYEWVYESSVDGVLREAKEAKAGNEVDTTGRPYGRKDVVNTVISWEGKAWRIGMIRYKTVQGLLRTCPLYTASEAEALAFYTKHGFTAAADQVVKEDR